VGYQLAGRVPIRAQGDGSRPVPGWTGSHEWTGTVAFDDLPHTLNPADGFVATANSRPPVPGNAFLTCDWTDDHRQQRVIDLLHARPRHAPADFQAMQTDVVSPAASAVACRLRDVGQAFEPDSGGVSLGRLTYIIDLFQKWDGQLDADSVA